ncbi:MAG: GNAT family N-acetyltransferase [Candidatus Bathyarchaeia archaeon]
MPIEDIVIVKYSKEKKEEWDKFVGNSKNGIFLFFRDYIEYHSDKFTDQSLMFYKDDKLIAIFPANITRNTLFSHAGLTFGGFITDNKMTTPTMLRLFQSLIEYAEANSINKIIYKCIPYIYHSLPADEDRYALFRINAKLFRRDITSTIYLPEKIQFQESRYRCIRKAKLANVEVKRTDCFKSYWQILEENLAKAHNTKPVHSIEEIEYLYNKFPDNIKLFVACKNEDILAGVVIYESKNVAHAQYIASAEKGRAIGALDMIFDYLINEYYKNKKYFDFGISTEKDGLYLNEGLIFFKEGFGARGIVHDFYEVNIE